MTDSGLVLTTQKPGNVAGRTTSRFTRASERPRLPGGRWKLRGMRMKLVLGAIAAAGALAPAAFAGPPAAGCGKVTVVLQGVVDASPGVSYSLPYGLLVDVAAANAHGRAYAKLPQPLTVLVG